MKRRYTVVLLPDAEVGGYVVAVPALHGCVTQGETIDEAVGMARDAIALYLEELEARDEYIPVESAPATMTTVEVDVAEPVSTATQ